MSAGEFVEKYGVFILGALNLLALIAAWISGWFAVPRREFDSFVNKVSNLLPRNEFDTHAGLMEGRVKRLEEYHKDGPSWEAVNSAKLEIAKLDGELKALKVAVDGVKDKTNDTYDGIKRIEQHLMDNKL